MRANLPWYLCPEKGPAKVEAHDGHPSKHCHAHKVSTVPEDLAGDAPKSFRTGSGSASAKFAAKVFL